MDLLAACVVILSILVGARQQEVGGFFILTDGV
jgi:hypothetical protein